MEESTCLSSKESLCSHENNGECNQNAEFNDSRDDCESAQNGIQDEDEERNENSSVISQADEVFSFYSYLYDHTYATACVCSCYYSQLQKIFASLTLLVDYNTMILLFVFYDHLQSFLVILNAFCSYLSLSQRMPHHLSLCVKLYLLKAQMFVGCFHC